MIVASGDVPSAGDGRPTGAEDLVAALEKRVGLALALPVTVCNLVRMAGGASRETWAFDAVTAEGAVRPLVLRCGPVVASGPGGHAAPGPAGLELEAAASLAAGAAAARGHAARGPASLELEAAASQAAGAAGVPVPAVVLAVDDAADLGGAGLVAQRIAGETLARRIYRALDAGGSGRRAALAGQCAVALARLHTVAPDQVAGLAPAVDPVEAQREMIDELGLVSPAFEVGLRWLAAHRPPPGRHALVHGDFRIGNLVVGADGLAAVLDWELVHTGDPLEDLGWFCSRAWRFGEDNLEAGGLCDLDTLARAYERESGHAVDRSMLAWWIVLADLRWGVICAKQAERHSSGQEESVELATIGRRIPEAEWDVLAGLRRAGWPEAPARDPGAVPAVDAAGISEVGPPVPGPDELHGRPSVAVLVAAVRSLLGGPIREGLTGPVAFQALVAANALRIVERQLLLGPAHRLIAERALAQLGCEDEVTLARDIRSGCLDDRPGLVASVVERIVAMRIDVVHPGYTGGP